jgi:hypothetical protein
MEADPADADSPRDSNRPIPDRLPIPDRRPIPDLRLISDLGLAELLDRVGAERPIFHNEADFQHHLALTINLELPRLKVRLESRPFPGERLQLDLLLIDRRWGERVAVELKYPTRALTAMVDGEEFHLRDQGAPDLIRYDVVKDVHRLERLIREGRADRGLALVLTNDRTYWEEPKQSRGPADEAFRLHQGRELAGTLRWGPSAGPGTTRGREPDLNLAGRYELNWGSFSAVTGVGAGEFRVLPIPVAAGRPEADSA